MKKLLLGWLIAGLILAGCGGTQPLQQYGAEALVQPYGLISHDPALDGGGLAPAVLPVALGQPFVLQGSTWSMKDGQVAVHWNGNAWVMPGFSSAAFPARDWSFPRT